MKDKYKELKPEAFKYQQEQTENDVVVAGIATVVLGAIILGLALIGILAIV